MENVKNNRMEVIRISFLKNDSFPNHFSLIGRDEYKKSRRQSIPPKKETKPTGTNSTYPISSKVH